MNLDHEEFRDNTSLTDIQLQLSVSDDLSITETERKIAELNDILNELNTDPKFKELYEISYCKVREGMFLNVIKMLKNEDRLNKMFFMYVTKVPKKKYKLYLMFVVFCDYFELPYDRTYSKLSVKIKRLLDLSLKLIIGNKSYNKLNKKHKLNNDDIIVNTLSDL